MATLSAISAKAGYCKAPTLSWKVINTEILVASLFVSSYLFVCLFLHIYVTSLPKLCFGWSVDIITSYVCQYMKSILQGNVLCGRH